MFGKEEDLQTLSKRTDNEGDPSSPGLVAEMLAQRSEWQNIQDVVFLTFKAVHEVLRAQSLTLREIEAVLPSKANKVDVQASLASKASVSDVTRTIAEVATNIESRATFEDLQRLVESKISRQDAQYLLGNKVGIEDVKPLLDEKADAR